MMNLKKAYLIVFIILLIDQITKIYVKTHFLLHEEIVITKWFKLLFVENEGMAWGVELPGVYGKLALTLFRICAVAGIGYWLLLATREKASNLLIIALSLIMAGAFGNIIDSIFYGVLFNHSDAQLATAFTQNPYGTWLYGKVVDMFYFPIWQGYLPQWIPLMGGKYFTFFNAIFNVADVAICIGVGILIVFNKKVFSK